MEWIGRIDGFDNDVLRMHQVINQMDFEDLLNVDRDIKKVCFVSYNSDEGVARNKGRIGASEGWKQVKAALSNFPVFDTGIKFYDLKNPINVIDGNLEKAQEEYANVVGALKDNNFFVVGLGGGHDIAYGTYNGILKHANKNTDNPKIGIISFDAHFDMRDYDNGGNSGTMFLQIADDCVRDNRNFDYNVIGIQKFSNTQRLFDIAKKFNVNYYMAEEINKLTDLNILPIIKRNDYIYMTICTDVFHITCAPGVSAPQTFGIWPSQAIGLISLIAKTAKNLTLDVAEISPRYDYDQRTSRLVANLIYQVILDHFKFVI